MKLISMKLLIFIFSILNFPQFSFTQNTNINYADWLYKQGFYDYALQEYLRMIYISNLEKDQNTLWVYNKVAECYLMSGEYEKGINWCENINEKYSKDTLYELNVTYSIILMKMGFFEKSEKILSSTVLKESPISNRVYFLLGCSEAHQWKLNDAINAWQNIPIDQNLNPIATDYISYTREAQKVNFLNPTYGAIFGIVPGLGYLYAGHEKTALSALIVIGLTSWGTFASFENNVDGIGYLTGFLTLGWYSGSIYGSYWACERKNEYNRRLYLKKIKY